MALLERLQPDESSSQDDALRRAAPVLARRARPRAPRPPPRPSPGSRVAGWPAAASRGPAPRRGRRAGRIGLPCTPTPRAAPARSRAGRSCRPAPGRARSCIGPPRSRRRPCGSDPRSCMNSMALSRLQPKACSPESTTRRAARNACASSMPEPLPVVQVEAHLVGEPLAVEAPALDVGHAGHPARPACGRRQPGQLHLDGELEVVARRRLVEGDGRDLVQRPLLRLVGVDVVLALRASRRSRLHVERRRRLALAVLLDRLDLAVGRWQPAEVVRRGGEGARRLLLGQLHDRLARIGVVGRDRRPAPRFRRDDRDGRADGRSRPSPPRCAPGPPARRRWTSSAVVDDGRLHADGEPIEPPGRPAWSRCRARPWHAARTHRPGSRAGAGARA